MTINHAHDAMSDTVDSPYQIPYSMDMLFKLGVRHDIILWLKSEFNATLGYDQIDGMSCYTLTRLIFEDQESMVRFQLTWL